MVLSKARAFERTIVSLKMAMRKSGVKEGKQIGKEGGREKNEV
jgi:hypothetical protein